MYFRSTCLSYPGCSQCCIRYWNVWAEFGVPPIAREVIPPDLSRVVDVEIDGRVVQFLCYDHTKYECIFLDGDKGCMIHNHNPISCMFPLVALKFKSGHLSISKRLFGRNRLVGCPVKFSPYESFEEFERDTISRFVRMKEHLDNLGVPNILDRIISELRSRFPRYLV